MVIYGYVYPYSVRYACIFIQLFVPLSCFAFPLTWYTESSLACRYAFQLYDMEEYHSSSFAFSLHYTTGEGHVTVRANSAHSILLHHNLTEPGVNYLCNVTAVEGQVMKEVNKNVTKAHTNVTGLLPDTTYRVDCVAYHSDGVEYCLEANTTVTTRELVHSVKVTVHTFVVHT